MKNLIIHITYDEDKISSEEIRDYIKEFIIATPAYIRARFHEEV